MDRERFAELLEEYDRLVVTGMPIAGKSIYSEMVTDRHLLHSDHLTHHPFRDRPAIMARELAEYERWVLAGVHAPYMMVKTGLLPDVVIWLPGPRTELEGRQKSFAKGTRTLFFRWKREHPDVPVFV